MKLKIQNPEVLELLLSNILDEIADEIFLRSQENLTQAFSYEGKTIDKPISDTGNLLKSGYVLKPKGLEKTVGYSCPYSLWVEFGTLPHPISQEGQEAILRWVERKLGLTGKKAINVANSIIWHIRKHGTTPKPFLRNAMTQVRNKYEL